MSIQRLRNKLSSLTMLSMSQPDHAGNTPAASNAIISMTDRPASTSPAPRVVSFNAFHEQAASTEGAHHPSAADATMIPATTGFLQNFALREQQPQQAQPQEEQEHQKQEAQHTPPRDHPDAPVAAVKTSTTAPRTNDNTPKQKMTVQATSFSSAVAASTAAPTHPRAGARTPGPRNGDERIIWYPGVRGGGGSLRGKLKPKMVWWMRG